jgi:hypothetical protein
MFFARFLTTNRAWGAAVVPLLIAAGCTDDTTAGPPSPSLTTIDVSVVSAMEVGQEATASATGRDQYGVPVDIGPIAWTSGHVEVAVINPRTGAMLAIAPGTTDITARVDGRSGQRTITVTRAPAIRVNEVQPREASGTGWMEVVNTTSSTVDLAGWALIDANFFGPVYTFPPNSVVEPGGRLVLEETGLPFTLDAADAVHLFSRFGVQVDGTFWVEQAARTRSRCPDGAGEFRDTSTPTKGTANACPERAGPNDSKQVAESLGAGRHLERHSAGQGRE